MDSYIATDMNVSGQSYCYWYECQWTVILLLVRMSMDSYIATDMNVSGQ